MPHTPLLSALIIEHLFVFVNPYVILTCFFTQKVHLQQISATDALDSVGACSGWYSYNDTEHLPSLAASDRLPPV
jgi:hypothetical protein